MASIPSAPIGGWAKLRNSSVSTYESALPYEDNDIIGHQGCSGARAKVSWTVMTSLFCLSAVATCQGSALARATPRYCRASHFSVRERY